MSCEKCQADILPGEEFKYSGRIICEDCYIDTLERPKPCDVTAVHSAKLHRASQGHTGTDGLTELQKNIYEYISDKGKATKAELEHVFKLSGREVEKQFTVMRHCELLKGKKEGQEIYYVLFDK